MFGKLVPVPSGAVIPERDIGKRPILNCINLGVTFGGLKAVDDFNMIIGRTEIAGLIGPNGAGKTTIFNLITKVYQPTTGTILIDGKDTAGMNTIQVNKAGIARTFQNIRLFNKMSVEDNVKIGLHNRMRYGMGTGILRLPNYWKKEKLMHEKALELLSIFNMENEANVKAALKKIAATAGANDEVIFFFSGHGGPGAFCLFDKNMTYYDLLSILSKSKCRNILVIIDACNSGSLAGAVTQLKKENKWGGNIASIVSSRASENSIENPLVGAGFLAQGIMKGLRGKADADGNKQLTIRELFRYTFNDVSTRAAKVDKAQHPQLIAPAAMQDNVIWKW